MEEIRELLDQLALQIADVEANLKRLNEIGHSDEYFVSGNFLGTQLRVQSDICMDVHTRSIRKSLELIEHELGQRTK